MPRIIIDVREPVEFKRGHIEGAINLPPTALLAGLPPALADTPKDTEVILYCLSGARSGVAIQLLRRHGFTNLINGINQDQVKAKYL